MRKAILIMVLVLIAMVIGAGMLIDEKPIMILA